MGLGHYYKAERERRREQERLYPELTMFPTEESREQARREAVAWFATTGPGRIFEVLITILVLATLFMIAMYAMFQIPSGAPTWLASIVGALCATAALDGRTWLARSRARRRLRLLLNSEGRASHPM